MANFAYNNAKNVNISYISFKLNSKYYSYIFYKDNLGSYSKSKTTEEPSFKLQDLMTIYQENFYYVQKL